MIIPAYCGEKPKRKLSHEIVEEHTNGIFGAARPIKNFVEHQPSANNAEH
jgi:hypothetical protein